MLLHHIYFVNGLPLNYDKKNPFKEKKSVAVRNIKH